MSDQAQAVATEAAIPATETPAPAGNKPVSGEAPAEHIQADKSGLETQNDDGALFNDEAVSESLLKGEQDDENPTKDDPSQGDEEPQDPAAKDDEAEEGKDDQTQEQEAGKAKPPAGHVPIAALHEERTKRQEAQAAIEGKDKAISSLKQYIEELEAEADRLSLQGKPINDDGDGEFTDFKLLSQQEFDDLLEDAPADAVRYQRQEQRYLEHRKNQATIAERRERMLSGCNQYVQKEIPNLREIGPKLTEFAVENGFPNTLIAELTDPQTKIIPPGKKNPVMLGHGAAGFTVLLSKLYNKVQSTDRDSIRAEVEKELRENIEKEITGKVLEKIKKQGIPDAVTLDGIPEGETDGAVDAMSITEDTFRNADEATRKRLLGG